MRMKVLAIQTNSEGRPCGWGISELFGKSMPFVAAKEEATRQWDSHCCYPGEEKGEMVIHVLGTKGEE